MDHDDRIASILAQWQERRDRGEDVDVQTFLDAVERALVEAAKPLCELREDRYTEFKPVGEGGLQAPPDPGRWALRAIPQRPRPRR